MYLFAGQSNMVGFAAYTHALPWTAPNLMAPPKHVEFFGPQDDTASRWVPLEAPTEIKGAMYQSGFGPELSAARALTWIHPDTDIALIKYAHGWTNLYHDWKAPSGEYYVKFIDRVRTAVQLLRAKYPGRPIKFAGMFWMQGENDSASRAYASVYGANLTNLIRTVRHDLGAPQMPFVIGQITDIGLFDRTWRYSYIVRDQQRRVAMTAPNTYLVPTAGLARSPQSPIHFSTRGTVDLGYRFVQRRFKL